MSEPIPSRGQFPSPPSPPLTPSPMEAAAAAVDQLDGVLTISVAYRTKLLAAGFSPRATERMVCDWHRSCMASLTQQRPGKP